MALYILWESIPAILFWIAKLAIVMLALFFTIKYAIKAALHEYNNRR